MDKTAVQEHGCAARRQRALCLLHMGMGVLPCHAWHETQPRLQAWALPLKDGLHHQSSFAPMALPGASRTMQGFA
ncbi:hypothetical protein CLI93_13735 [Vandammella animalimorsus]|nr:hypothetical protein CLI93_13735 [Vandammella animalimorsus]